MISYHLISCGVYYERQATLMRGQDNDVGCLIYHR